jgi:hypothetical protein
MYDWKPLDVYCISFDTGGGQMKTVSYLTKEGMEKGLQIAVGIGSDVINIYREHEHKSIPGNKLFIPCTRDGRSVACGTALPSEILK